MRIVVVRELSKRRVDAEYSLVFGRTAAPFLGAQAGLGWGLGQGADSASEATASGRFDLRSKVGSSPPSVEYSLTELGHELRPALVSLVRVGELIKHRKRVG